MKHYYKTLGLPGDATIDAIKGAYQKLAIKWHPDKNPKNVKVASKKFANISEAYEILSDKKKRKEYDRYLQCRRNSKRSHKQNIDGSTLDQVKILGNVIRKFVVYIMQEALNPLKKAFSHKSSKKFDASSEGFESCVNSNNVFISCKHESEEASTSAARTKKRKVKIRKMLEEPHNDDS